jgi:hypothetical protein
VSASRGRDRGLIFGLIRMRSSTFFGIQINAAIQVTDVSVTRRTIIPSPETRKVGGSTPLDVPVRPERVTAYGEVLWLCVVSHGQGG